MTHSPFCGPFESDANIRNNFKCCSFLGCLFCKSRVFFLISTQNQTILRLLWQSWKDKVWRGHYLILRIRTDGLRLIWHTSIILYIEKRNINSTIGAILMAILLIIKKISVGLLMKIVLLWHYYSTTVILLSSFYHVFHFGYSRTVV